MNIRFTVAKLFIVLGVVCVFANSQAHASTLVFQPASGTFGNDAPLPSGYGNRVISPLQDGYLYGLAGGPTPNVTTSYDLSVSTWDNDFGDLFHVVYAEGDSLTSVFRMDLIADPGYMVSLNSFDMAAWPHIDYTINYVRVLDETNSELYRQNDVDIEGLIGVGEPEHTHFAFSGIAAQRLRIEWDATNVDSDDVGITNIEFSQALATATVPEPATILLLGIGGLAAAGQALRKRRKLVG